MTHPWAVIAGAVMLLFVLLDAFQTIILPRRPVGRFRITRLFFIMTWLPWVALVKRVPSPRVRDQLLSFFGPVGLLLLMIVWAAFLMNAFALTFLGLGLPFVDGLHGASLLSHYREGLYVSGTTLFTLGLGDVTPATQAARGLMVTEAGFGLGFIALVIGYVPVLYGAFSHREVSVALLDARAGSPPTAGELLLRHNFEGGAQELTGLLNEWERWSAEMLESHVSYPILCYYRSQHDNQSWLAAITAILDTCALLITTVEGPSTRQAQRTFVIARHTLVDLGHVFHQDEVIARCTAEAERARRDAAPAGGCITFSCTESNRAYDRLSDAEFARLCVSLRETGFQLCASDDTQDRLRAIRLLYEPQARAMSEYLQMDLPLWMAPPHDPNKRPDPWTTVSRLRAGRTPSTPDAGFRQEH